jgi:zinc transporter ZupT
MRLANRTEIHPGTSSAFLAEGSSVQNPIQASHHRLLDAGAVFDVVNALRIYLGVFGGFLLYIGAADILPEAHAGRSSPWAIALTCFGTLCIYLVTRVLR